MMARPQRVPAVTVHYANTIIVGLSLQKLLSLSLPLSPHISDLDTEKAKCVTAVFSAVVVGVVSGDALLSRRLIPHT